MYKFELRPTSRVDSVFMVPAILYIFLNCPNWCVPTIRINSVQVYQPFSVYPSEPAIMSLGIGPAILSHTVQPVCLWHREYE